MDEPESTALARALSAAALHSSVVARVEVTLAARRELGDAGAAAAERAVSAVALVGLSDSIAVSASRLDGLPALDAIHLATALSLRDDLDGFVTYDRRLGAAAEAERLRVLAPA